MADGEYISYPNQSTLQEEFKKKLGASRAGKNPAGYSSLPRFCMKVSATAPGTRDEDKPDAIGDICVHYNVAGVIQDIYVATALTPTWVKLQA